MQIKIADFCLLSLRQSGFIGDSEISFSSLKLSVDDTRHLSLLAGNAQRVHGFQCFDLRFGKLSYTAHCGRRGFSLRSLGRHRNHGLGNHGFAVVKTSFHAGKIALASNTLFGRTCPGAEAL